MVAPSKLMAWQLGADINRHGRVYAQGKSYSYIEKVEVAARYLDALTANEGRRPNLRQLQRDCKVSWSFVRKIERELRTHGRVLNPGEVYKNQPGPIGPGSKTIGEAGAFVLYLLYSEEPSRVLSSYVYWLEKTLHVKVSESTISRVFKEAFPFKAGLYRPNLVPYDKFRPGNLERAVEYLTFIALVDPTRIKFGDEKLLKGRELYNRNVRRDPFTGVIPPVLTAADFRNAYSMTAFCSIDDRSPALFFNIHDCNNDATQFAADLEAAIASGFFHPGDILVLDNAAYHTGGENTVLENWLWTRHGIFLLFLPARCPELNPVEQVWKTLVRRMKKFPLDLVDGMQHKPAIAAYLILALVDRRDLVSMYRHSGLLVD